MRTVKIVVDSSANRLQAGAVALGVAPLKIIAGEREFVDDAHLDVDAMVRFFDTYSGRSQTSCPNPSDWLEAFGDADDIFCITITSGLSGSYNAACAAKGLYEAEHEGRRVFVLDSLSTGPEMELLMDRLETWILSGMDYEEICANLTAYTENTGLLFVLESLKNFAANGRVSPAVAKLAGLLGIRVMGKASDKGTLEPLHKCRGEAKALDAVVEHLQQAGGKTGKVRIAHNHNEAAAERLVQMIRARLPKAEVSVTQCRGLCSYYAERGGLLVGFEAF